ncbi:hypothetical protein Hanom_Chr14g01323431 [Helianthus anomalus]
MGLLSPIGPWIVKPCGPLKHYVVFAAINLIGRNPSCSSSSSPFCRYASSPFQSGLHIDLSLVLFCFYT